MAAVFFDFDSTLVPCESLEVLCARCATLDAAQQAALEAITRAGMEGTLPFEASLRQRLEIVAPRLPETLALAADLASNLSAGAAALVERLRAAGHEVWIVSGGFLEILLAAGRALGLPDEAVHGVACRWAEDGSLEDLDPTNGFLVSKVEGLRRLAHLPAGPRIGIGDGATDLALRDAGYVDTFVAYTEHAHRPVVADRADFEAASMADLERILGTLLT
jgi:phosphoserine phosphatase